MSQGSKITLTAELKDQASAPLDNLKKKAVGASEEVAAANKRQAASADASAAVYEKAMARAAGSTEVLEKALGRAGAKQADALHKFDQASQGVTIAERRLEEVRGRTDAGSTARLTAEKSLTDARYRQEKALHAVAAATGELEDAQASLLAQNGELESMPEPRQRMSREEVGQTLAPAVTAVGGAMTLGFGKALTTYADFDKAMAQVKAFTQESDENMALLRDAAMKYGADTAYSAAEAAGAINELGKAGVSTQDILAGGLKGALSLAAAGELEVSKAAEIAAATLVQFKLSGDQIPHLADLLAAGAGKAQGSVEDLGMALNQAGLVASATGLNVEETTGTLAAFASSGLLGSDAGTSFKTMLQRLTPQSKEAAAEMERLNISAYDANGQFIGMSNFAGVLKDGMKDLTDEQRMASMGIIFGSDAVRAANVLYEQGAEGIADWTDKVNDAGYAAKTAADLQDNLAGDLEKLGGSIDTVFLQSGSGMNDILRGMVQGLEDVVDWLGTLDPKMLSTVGVLGGFTGAGLLAAGAFLMIVPKIRDTMHALQDFNAHGGRSAGVINGIAKAAGKLAVLVVAGQALKGLTSNEEITSAEEYRNAIVGVTKAGEAAKASDLDGLFQKWDLGAGAEGDAEAVNSLSESIKTLSSPTMGNRFQNFINPVTSAIGFTNDEITQVEGKFKDMGDAMGELVSNGGAESAADSFRLITKEFEANGKSAQDALNYLPGYKDALLEQANAANVSLSEQELLNWAMTGMEPAAITAARATEAAAEGMDTSAKAAGGMSISVEEATEYLADFGITLEGVVSDMEKYLEFLFATGLAVMSSRDAQASYQDALRGVGETVDELIEKNGNLSGVLNKNKTDFDLTTEAGATANAAFQDLARGGMDQVKAMANEGLGQDELQGKLTGTYNDLIEAADAFGITGQAGVDLTRKIMGIPDGVKIDSWMSSEAKRVAEETKGVVDQLDGSTAHVWVTTHKHSIYSETHQAATYTGSDGMLRNAPGGRGGQTVNSGGGVYMDLPAAAGGAIVPGYAPGVDSEIMRVSPGEALLVPELVREIGPENIMALNHIYSGGRPAGGGPARASMATVMERLSPFTGLRAAAGGAVLTAPRIPDTVPVQWVREQQAQQATPSLAPVPVEPSRSPAPSIKLDSGAVQVTVDGSGLSPAQIQTLVEAAVTEALAKKQQEMEQSY